MHRQTETHDDDCVCVCVCAFVCRRDGENNTSSLIINLSIFGLGPVAVVVEGAYTGLSKWGIFPPVFVCSSRKLQFLGPFWGGQLLIKRKRGPPKIRSCIRPWSGGGGGVGSRENLGDNSEVGSYK